MPQAYSDPSCESDPHALPDIEVFELTAREVAAQDEDIAYEFMKRPEFRLAAINSKVREKLLDAIIEEAEITGGWFWWACFPGCLPDGPPNGPFDSYAEALADAQNT